VIENMPLSSDTHKRLSEWVEDRGTPARLRAIGFPDADIERVLQRTRNYVAMGQFPQVKR
jgi:hypothetical protein